MASSTSVNTLPQPLSAPTTAPTDNTTAGSTNHFTLSEITLARIISETTQAVMANLQSHTIPSTPLEFSTETRELPVVASGVLGTADATMQGPVASALLNISGFEVQTASSGGRSANTDSHTASPSPTQLAAITSRLIQSSLQPSSIPTYRRAWKLYNQFSSAVFQSASVKLPISPSDLGLFIAFMFQRNYAASTANTYVSALGYCHRLTGVHDPTKVFWVLEMLKGYGKLGSGVDARLPITISILRTILQQTSLVASSEYRALLFRAMCTTAFFAFLRVGEITTCPRSPGVLQLSQVVQLVDNLGNISGLKINFANFKHSYNQPRVSLTLHRRSDICPVQTLLDYFARRGLSDGPLFRTLDGRAVTRRLFTEHLALIFRACGLDPTKYKGHSFRIGAATFAAECGFSDAQIRVMGRWKSDAFRKYIRSPNLSSRPMSHHMLT
ncbi:uncharacterized protein LOC114528322 [Dendronephthya gigantea]|uniref:uncharacterized protein LOC114528322 n=1 Tax=Dendronephthya gigantea TaxID=151771 RepID=UPI00106AE6FA|nr:uncharacterized protein LOC114528322 [Dendronephthya gigantea]